MNDIYTDKKLVLSHLVDSNTGKNIVIDISGMTLPQRRQLKIVGDVGRRFGAKLSAWSKNQVK